MLLWNDKKNTEKTDGTEAIKWVQAKLQLIVEKFRMIAIINTFFILKLIKLQQLELEMKWNDSSIGTVI